MLSRFEQTICGNELITPGDRVLCAISGGADSVALLLLLRQLATALPLTLFAAHLDHGLRPESRGDARFVEQLCARLEVPLVSERVDVAALAAELREGTEVAGRIARQTFLQRQADALDCQAIALAHHADDQAETVLFRLIRGSGLTGLAAMRPRSGRLIRPLLPFRKAELCAWLAAQGVDWREDASNQDPGFSRNRLRHQVLPELRQLNPQVDTALCRLSRQAALEEDYWWQQVESVINDILTPVVSAEEISVRTELLLELHPALRRRVLRGLLARLRGGLQRISAVHLEQIDALLEHDRPQAETLLPGAWVARRYDRLLLSVRPPVTEPYAFPVTAPGDYPLPTGDTLRVSIGAEFEPGPDRVGFAAGQVAFPLSVRSPRPGDRFVPSGMSGHKRLKNYFIDRHIHAEQRRTMPLVCAGETLLWLAGERRCEGYWPQPGAAVLQMQLLRADFVDE